MHGLAARSPELQGLGRSDRQLCYKAACDQRDETTYHRFFVFVFCLSFLIVVGFVFGFVFRKFTVCLLVVWKRRVAIMIKCFYIVHPILKRKEKRTSDDFNLLSVF